MPDPAPLPLQRDTFPAHRLMTEHPPVLRDPNKQVVFDVACPAGTVHEGEIGYSRWPTMPLPERIALGHADHFIEVRVGVYDYAPTTRVAGAEEWHVNFADPRLFTAYGSGLFAQDEMQVAEHPALGALCEALHARRWPTLTEERGQATPVLVKGVQRRCRVQTDANPAELRPHGLYGNQFMMAKADAVRRATVRLEPPTVSNLVAIAALRGGRGTYSSREIEYLLTTAYSGFRAAVIESGGAPTVVHTGYWGCGAFGGNRVLMSLVQLVSARAAGVERMVFYTVTAEGRAEVDLAVEKMGRMSVSADIATPAFIERTLAMGLRWGQSDGN